MVKIKYVFQRGETYYWQRKIPTDLLDRYPSSAPLKINLQTNDPKVVASKVAKLNRQHEALWGAMRKDPSLTPQSAREEARKLLKAHGLEITGRGSHEAALSMFMEHLDQKRQSYAEGSPEPEEAYHFAEPHEYLSKPEQEALKLIAGANQFLLSDAVEVYLEEHHKRGRPGFDDLEAYTRRVWKLLTDALGDKVFREVTREDAKTFRGQLAAKVSTETTRRYINVVKAVFAKAIVEKSLNIPNVWESLKIAGLGEDSEKRESFTGEELKKLRELCKAKDDDMRWLAAIQVDTGARIGELAGMALADIHIQGEAVPYIDIRPHPWRTLKTANSIRMVPLVGDALWGARRVLENASKGQGHAFPRYIKEGKCLTDSASAALNKWMKLSGLDKTTHELRHTMRDRLRNSGATRDIQDAVGGWGKSEIADNYGKGYALQMMRDALLKTLPVVPGKNPESP